MGVGSFRHITAAVFAGFLLILMMASSATARAPMPIALVPFHPTIYSKITLAFYAPSDLPADRHYYLDLLTPPATAQENSTCSSATTKDYNVHAKKGQLVKLTITPQDSLPPSSHWCVAPYSMAGIFEMRPGDPMNQAIELGSIVFAVRK